MEERQFNPGDQVVFKTWEELKEEFAYSDGAIRCNMHFTEEMEESIDKEKIYTIREIRPNGTIAFTEDPSQLTFAYSTDMIKHVGEGKSKIASYYFREWVVNGELKRNLRELNLFDGLNDVPHSAYRTLLCALTLGTGSTIHSLSGKHVNSPEELYTYLINRRGTYKIGIELNSLRREDEFDTWAVENEAAKLTFGKNLAYIKKDVMLILSESPTVDDEFTYELVKTMHDVWNIPTNEELYGYILNRDPESGKRKMESLIKLVLEAQRREKFSKEIQELKRNMKSTSEASFKNDIDDIQRNIRSSECALETLYSQLQEKKKELAYFKFYNGKDEIVEDFLSLLENDYENISYIEVGSYYLRLVIKQPLLFFDDEEWLTIKDGFLSERRSVNHVFSAIFERKAQIMFEQGVIINFSDSDVQRYNDADQKEGVPNPHIGGYDCWDANGTNIRVALRQRRYDIAYATIKSAIAGVSVVDSPVMDRLHYYLRNFTNIPCITDLETGVVMTIEEAEKFYREKEEGNQE